METVEGELPLIFQGVDVVWVALVFFREVLTCGGWYGRRPAGHRLARMRGVFAFRHWHRSKRHGFVPFTIHSDVARALRDQGYRSR